ncbi:hypothetical protein ACFS7Z_22735 [Pontibacter toksunensis]|uniref:Uncharacterized protein n=1 Tax=Pontibacter toksunensis TaxID=1332631 RepID=A0ABW6C042_9BACT
MTNYKATGGNAHDGAADVLKGMAENFGKGSNNYTTAQIAVMFGL